MDTSDYRALHAETQLDPLASELAAGHFAQGYLALAEDEEQQQPQPGDLAEVSDRVWTLPDLSLEQDAIQEIFAI